MCSLPDPAIDTIVLFNMKDDPEYKKMMFPFGLAYVASVDPFRI
jgi:hypothetical protein